ncbi:MAG: hypothetical protein R3F60_31185 [bacterium]
MAILLVEDATGAVVVAMGEDFDRWEAEISADEPLLLRGPCAWTATRTATRVSLRLGTGRRGETPDPDERLVERLSVVREQRSSGLELTAPARAINADRLHALNSLLRTASTPAPARRGFRTDGRPLCREAEATGDGDAERRPGRGRPPGVWRGGGGQDDLTGADRGRAPLRLNPRRRPPGRRRRDR